jgi:hypothetical protein
MQAEFYIPVFSSARLGTVFCVPGKVQIASPGKMEDRGSYIAIKNQN